MNTDIDARSDTYHGSQTNRHLAYKEKKKKREKYDVKNASVKSTKQIKTDIAARLPY